MKTQVPRFVLALVPLALAVVTALHPTGDPEHVFATLSPHIGRWMAVHYLQLILLPVTGVVVMYLLRDVRTGLAAAARGFLAVFVVLYSVFDAVAGLAVGALIQHATALEGAEQRVLANAAEWLFSHPVLGGAGLIAIIAAGAWLLGCITAAVALRKAGYSLAGAVLLCLAGGVFAISHAPPYGPIGMALLAASVIALRPPALTASSLLNETEGRVRRPESAGREGGTG
jgi:hypothetical protein